MSKSRELAELIERVTTGDPWHGPNLASLLQDLTAADANRRLHPGTHSIWELVLHMTGWTREVLSRLDGAPADEPAGGDWPLVGDTGDEAWTAARAAVFASHASLIEALGAFDDAALEQPVNDTRDPATGTGLSKWVTLHGLVHHTVYHSGQIAMIRRSLG